MNDETKSGNHDDEVELTNGEETASVTSSYRKNNPVALRTISQKVADSAAHIKAPPSWGVLLLFVPMALILFAIRLRHDQVTSHEDDDDKASGSYSSSYSSKSSSSSYSSSYGDDHVSTVFTLAETIDPVETSLCFAVIIGATMILDFLIESLNELCESLGHVYLQLSRTLYQELMLLGIISFTIFLMNAEGYFVDKTHLFHEVEYAHIIVFYIGLGLLVQGLALAIVNKEVKAVWKFSTEQTLDEISVAIADTKASFMGDWKIKSRWTASKRHLDIHLVRIKFLEIMNFPTNFAYNEYVNNALDETTLKIATNTWATWLSIIVLIVGAAHLHETAFFMGTDKDGYNNFMLAGTLLFLTHVALYAAVSLEAKGLLAKLGASGDVEQEFQAVKAIWPQPESWHDLHHELRDLEQKVIDDAKKSKREKHKNIAMTLKGAAQSVRTAARLSAVGRRAKNLGKRVKACDRLTGMGIDQKKIAKFHRVFLRALRVANLMQAFYISLILAHWGWYAPSVALAYLELLPIFVIYIALTPRIVRSYALIMSLGKPNIHALSATIEFMDHNEQALHQVAELIINSKQESETIDDVFSDWDTSGDGELSFKELQEAMFANNMHMQKARLKAMWRKIDIDSGGTISRSEFRRALTPYMAMVQKGQKVKAGMLPAAFERGSSLDRATPEDSASEV